MLSSNDIFRPEVSKDVVFTKGEMSFFSFGDSPKKANEGSFFTHGDDFADQKEDGQKSSFFDVDWSSKAEDPLPPPSPAVKKRKENPGSSSKNVRKTPEKKLTMTKTLKEPSKADSGPGGAGTPSKASTKDAVKAGHKDERNLQPFNANEPVDCKPEVALLNRDINLEDLYTGAMASLKQFMADKSPTVRKNGDEPERLLGRSSLLLSEVKNYRIDLAGLKDQYTSRLNQVSSFLRAMEQRKL